MAGTISIVAAVIRNDDGHVLLVRKRGTTAFMQPGGKRDGNEDDVTALAREIEEELGCGLVRDSVRPFGEFDAVSANEPGWRVRATLYEADVIGDIAPKAEIEEVIWVDPARPGVALAPLTRDHVLPRVAG
ncbi:MAG: hydrolase, nudix family [Tardiphaga sp.]|jgi:8-oxo-dGTP diphosphatase|nr:hydrolase, nudix family [Tardiphaga sp.]